jgi:hypothetical protein
LLNEWPVRAIPHHFGEKLVNESSDGEIIPNNFVRNLGSALGVGASERAKRGNERDRIN